MSTIKPYSPQDARDNPRANDYAVAAVNGLLAMGRRQFTQNEVIIEILRLAPTGTTKQQIFDQHWLDFEPYFRKAGWGVYYDKPGYNEDYEASFTFTEGH
jgi:hypothetical protein